MGTESNKKEMLFYAEVVPHKCQRYETPGDWQILPNGVHISISDTGSKLSNLLIALHEVVEAILCEAGGIDQEAVDKFDMDYEANRTDESLAEPGDEPSAPYHRQHKVADIVERMIALQLGVPWQEHCDRVEAL